jgi:hypothetical protein
MQITSHSWSVAISAARESVDTLSRCIRAALLACKERRAVIDVLINGNHELAQAIAGLDWSGAGNEVRIWSIRMGDKAHTWNEYLHRIWPVGATAFFIDGYAEVKPGALQAMSDRLACSSSALGATGVPTCGRSAGKLREQMLKSGGIHGNLYAIRADTMHALRERHFRLPLGLYRTDPLLGSVLMFGLDPENNKWDPSLVVVEPNATWDVRGLSDITWKNISSQAKRMVRQAQGDLENRAAREHLAVKRLAPQLLPATVKELVHGWVEEHPEQARSLFFKRPLCFHAARKLNVDRDWTAASVPPVLMAAASKVPELSRQAE